jgi:cytochrome c oxidase subunit 4
MEMRRHQPIVRLFSVLGFFWVGILFSLIMVDYLTR